MAELREGVFREEDLVPVYGPGRFRCKVCSTERDEPASDSAQAPKCCGEYMLPVRAEVTEQLLVALCAWCGRVRDERGAWVHLEEMPAQAHGVVTHGICPSCRDKARATIPHQRGNP